MQKKKKLFVEKNVVKTHKRSYLSLFLWAALGLLLLVVLAPFAIRQKSSDREIPKPPVEKGVLVKEIPKPEPPPAERFPQGPGTGGEGLPRREETGASLPDFKSFPGAREGGGTMTPAERGVAAEPPRKAGEQGMAGQQAAATPDRSPHEPAPSMSPRVSADAPDSMGGASRKGQIPRGEKADTTAALPADPKLKEAAAPVPTPVAPKPESKEFESAAIQTPSAPEPPRKTTDAPPEKTVYIVQVGSFKDKQNAEEIKQNLTKRGYNVLVKPHNHPKLGQLYVVQLEPVADVGKANTLMTQISHEEKVKPFVVKVPPGQ